MGLQVPQMTTSIAMCHRQYYNLSALAFTKLIVLKLLKISLSILTDMNYKTH